MSLKNLSKQKEVFDYFKSYSSSHDTSPSLSQIGKAVKLSKSTVHKYLMRLEDEGYLTRNEKNLFCVKGISRRYESIPVVGSVACGKPTLAQEDIELYIPISKELLGKGDFIALRTKGDSMKDIGICEGDIVFVRRQASCDDGDIVVALTPDENGDGMNATLKRFFKDPEHQCIRLHPENKELKDIYVKECVILGVAVQVLKNII